MQTTYLQAFWTHEDFLAEKESRWGGEPSLLELLEDPIVQRLMRRDRVFVQDIIRIVEPD